MDNVTPEHQLLLLIGREGRSSIKIQMLKKYSRSPKLRNIFDYAVNPFKRFYIKKIPPHIKGAGIKVIRPATWSILDRLTARTLSGAEAKRVLFAHMIDLTPNEAHLLKKVIWDDLRVGVSVQTINAVWPGLIPTRIIQKAEEWNPDKVKLPALVSLKLDGVRAEYHEGLFYTRKGRTVTGLDHIKSYLESVSKFGNWDGELIVPGADFDEASGIIRSLRKSKPMVHYAVFDDLSIKGLPQRMRYEALEQYFKPYLPLGLLSPATYLPHTSMASEGAIMALFSAALKADQEGLMIKGLSAPYSDGRNYNWMKLKKGVEAEYMVVDVYEGEKGDVGTMGGIIVMLDNGQLQKVGSGFAEEQQAEWWSAPTKIVGKQATIWAMMKTKAGMLRHPVFKDIRWDL